MPFMTQLEAAGCSLGWKSRSLGSILTVSNRPGMCLRESLPRNSRRSANRRRKTLFWPRFIPKGTARVISATSRCSSIGERVTAQADNRSILVHRQVRIRADAGVAFADSQLLDLTPDVPHMLLHLRRCQVRIARSMAS